MLTTLVLVTACAAVPALGQGRQIPTFGPSPWTMSPEYRQVQRAALETQRRILNSMADSMPENQFRDKVTPPQRDFAQQLHHVVSSNVFIANAYLPVANAPAPPQADTAAVFNTRAGMHSYINASYDWLEWLLDHQQEADRNIMIGFFNQQRMPRWQVWDELNQHAFWTLGQTVANFRKQGMAPPSFLFF
jgi:hypothetical protein